MKHFHKNNKLNKVMTRKNQLDLILKCTPSLETKRQLFPLNPNLKIYVKTLVERVKKRLA